MINQFSYSIRFLKTISLLSSPNGTTIKKLVNSLGISRRSVFRLLNTFEELGFPIIEDKPQSKSEKIYSLADTYIIKLPNISIPNPFLTGEEIINIMALIKVCKQYNMMTNTLIFNSINEKLKAMIPNGKK